MPDFSKDESEFCKERRGLDKFECTLCGEKFKCSMNAENHLVQHNIPVEMRKKCKWKNYFIKLC